MRIREVKKPKVNKPRDPNAKAMQDLRKSGAAGSHGDKTKDIPRNDKHKGKDAHDIDETATPGATSAGNIATVANPHIANSKKKPKTQKPTDNALDNKSHGLFGQPLKRLNNSKELNMNSKDLIKENLADEASKVEQDHEVQMARAQLYKIAKYSIKLHEMLKNVSEQEGLEGWVQSKITKASDYIGAVYHNMDYEQKFEEVSETIKEGADCGCDEHESHSKCDDNCGCDQVTEAKDTHCSDKCCGSDVKAEDCGCKPTCEHCNCNAVSEGKAKNPKQQAAIAIAKKEKGYKESLADKLANEQGEYVYEKQKGVDGKVCWKGYKRMGTKKKGGKTVDNCVKM